MSSFPFNSIFNVKSLFKSGPDKYLRYNVFLLFLVLGIFQVNAQEPSITVFAEEKPLAEVLEEISGSFGIKFAYETDSFRKIKTSFSLEDASLELFFEELKERYSVSSNLIDGTWVLVIQKLQAEEFLKTETPKRTTLSGYVRDKITGESLVYCNISWGEFKGGMTNELGFFNFPVPSSDSVHLFVSHLGYRKLDTVVFHDKPVIINLEPSEIMLKPVRVVHTEREVLQASPLPEKIAFNPLKSSAIPRISNDDLGNALLLIPGVDFLQGGNSGLSIRGGAPTDNLVLFDGIPVLETSHLLGNMSVLNARFVQQAFVSRGGFDAGNGGRVSGLIELTGKSGKNNRPYLDLSANLLNSNILANVPVTGKFSVTAAWRRSFIDRWQNYLYFRLIDNVTSSDENPVTSTIIPRISFQDVNAKVSFHPTEHFEIDLNLLYGKDNQSRDFELLQTKDYYRNESMYSENLGMSLNWKWQVNPRWYHSFSAGFSTWDKDAVDETGELQEFTEIVDDNPGKGQGKGKGLAKTREITYTREIYDIDNGFNHIEEYRAAWKTKMKTGKITSEAGIGWTRNNYNYHFFASRSDADIQTDSIASEASLDLLHVFARQHTDISDQFRFRLGLRSDFDASAKNFYWQPRGGVEFLPQHGLKFYLLSGVYYQFLTGIRRFDSEGHYSRLWYLPDGNGRGAVKGVHYILGSKYEKNGWFVDIEAYHKNSSGKVNFFAREVASGSGSTVSYSSRESNERFNGIDFFIQKKHFLFNHMLSYSLSSAEEQTEDFFGNNWFPGYNDRTHRLKLTEMVNWRNWTFTGSWQIASGLPVYQYIQGSTTEDFFRSEHFAQLDLALMKTYKGTFYALSGGVSLLNVFDRRNIVEVNYLRFSSDQGSMTVRSDISALGFTPVFFLNVKF
jgi:hypothetical protein